MNNNERRSRIQALNRLVHPLLLSRTRASLRFNFLTNRYTDAEGKDPTQQETEELEQVRKRLEDLEAAITPLAIDLRLFQVKYEVEYEGEVWDGRMPVSVRNKKEFFLSTDCDIDTQVEWPVDDFDVTCLENELTDYIYNQEYGRFKIWRIRRVKA
jgi:hypothetical protein